MKRIYLLIPVFITVLGWAVAAQAASKNDLENNGFNCAQVGAPLPTVTRCEKCETDPQKGTVRCDVYYCDQSGANCHPQAALDTADPQDPDLDHPLFGLGDVNLDGVADIAVGDPAHGQVVVLSGADSVVLATVESSSPSTSFGQWASGIEDINGDAVADIVVKDPTDGQPTVFSGVNGAKLATLDRMSPSDETTLGTPLPELGRVAGDAVIGDINGDRVADLAVVDASNGQVLIFSGADSSVLSILAVPSLLDPVNTRNPRTSTKTLAFGNTRPSSSNKALTFGNACVERSKYVKAGSWRTLETLWNAGAQGFFRLPAGAQIKVRRGVGWFGWDTQKQTLDGVNTKTLSSGTSVILSRMQMKVTQSTYVSYTYCPVGP
ncbi:MAG: hypothetical protein AB7G75_27090 [Candidatus Binatia bacterium]